jgi:dihydroxyacetone kinase
VVESARPEEAAAAALARDALGAVHAMVLASEDEFGRIDAVAGDGDHGIGMSRGVTGALAAAEQVATEGGGIVRLLAEAGEAWSEHGGGTSGALWGIALTGAGTSLAKETAVDGAAVSRAVDAALFAVQNLGKAEVGDKTMIDSFVPFADELRRAVAGGDSLATAWSKAAQSSTAAAVATADLLPRLGRARPHAEKSLGHPDAGAISLARIATTVGEWLAAARVN